MADASTLARIVAAVERGDSFSLACLDDVAVADAWAACECPALMCWRLLYAHDVPRDLWRDASAAWSRCVGAAWRGAGREASPRECADAIRAAVAPPIAAELRAAADARRATTRRA